MRDIKFKIQPSTFQVLSHPNICCLDKYIHSFIKHVQTVAEASAGKQQWTVLHRGFGHTDIDFPLPE